MTKYYNDYVWINGLPYGLSPSSTTEEKSYKISMDPYRKRISIEKYKQGTFLRVIYDSALFDFRHLKPEEQTAWQKTPLLEAEDMATSLIRNQDDRLILIETYHFANGLCKKSFAKSSHGIPISRQDLFYQHLGDAFNGIIMYDDNEHPIMLKVYEFDEKTLEFTNLLELQWDMRKPIL